MAECPIKNCDWRGKQAGVPIHLARVHKLRFQHDEVYTELPTELPTNLPTASLRPEESTPPLIQVVHCPVPFCTYKSAPESVRGHLENKHPEWRMSNGRFVFEVDNGN